MNFIDEIDGIDRSRVLGLDHNSRSLAFALVADGKLQQWGKLLYGKSSDLYERYRMMPGMIDRILEATNPTYVMLEKSIVINSPQTAVLLAEVNGGLMCQFANRGFNVDTVVPMSWMAFHGNERVDKRNPKFAGWKEKQKKEFKKKQTSDKIASKWGIIVDDDDITDAMGVACYGAQLSLKDQVVKNA